MFRKKNVLPQFHPSTKLRDWSSAAPGAAYLTGDAQTGCIWFGATGSGKTSSSKHIATAYLAHSFGGIVLCAKNDERPQWERWAEEAGIWDRRTQTGNLIIFDASARWRFNPLAWEATRSGSGGGLAMNIVAMLDEIAGAVADKPETSGGDNKWFEDAMHDMNVHLVSLPIFAGLPVSLPLLRTIVDSAPQTVTETQSREWLENSVCATLLREGDEATRHGSEDIRADYEECRSYWMLQYPRLSEKTRSIINLSFSILVQPLISSPLRALFSTDTNVTPEAAFEGKVIIIDLPIQEFHVAGRIANLLWKYCFQRATLRRTQPHDGSYLRPVFLWADECQNFITSFDSEYQAVARSAGGCTVYLVQNRESLIRVLHSEAAVDSFLGNMQTKCFAQSTGETAEYASRLLGERWVMTNGTNVGRSTSQIPGHEPSMTGGVTRHEQLRRYVDPARFTTLRRGGPANNYQVDVIVYKGGYQFASPDGKEKLPYALLTFNQI